MHSKKKKKNLRSEEAGFSEIKTVEVTFWVLRGSSSAQARCTSTTTTCWQARGTKNSHQDSGEAAHQTLSVFCLFLFDGDIKCSMCLRKVSNYRLSCC